MQVTTPTVRINFRSHINRASYLHQIFRAVVAARALVSAAAAEIADKLFRRALCRVLLIYDRLITACANKALFLCV